MAGENDKGIRLSREGEGVLGRPTGRNHLLVIAIDEYAHCPKLNNCVKDAREFIEILTQKYQFDPEHLTTLYNAEATRANILARLNEQKHKIQPGDNLVIYFSGHGETEDDVGYWVPVAAHPENNWEFVSTYDIKSRLDPIPSFHTFVIVDACFSGSLFSSYKSVARGYETKRSRWGLAASHSRERALDGAPGENSPFATTLLNQLNDNRENLPAQELALEVIKRVEQATEGRQTPVFRPLNVKGDDSGQYVFHLRADEARDWAACQKTDTLAAYQAFLAKYPAGQNAGAARRRVGEVEEEAAWALAKKGHTLLSYAQYNQRYPAGKYLRESLEAMHNLEEERAWNRARQRNSLADYFEYKSNYPDGRFIKEAEEQIQTIIISQEEPAAWQRAKSQETIEAYESYLRQYPAGAHAIQARTIAKERRQKAAEEEIPLEARGMLHDLQRARRQEQWQKVRKRLPLMVGWLIIMVVIWGITQWPGQRQTETHEDTSAGLDTMRIATKDPSLTEPAPPLPGGPTSREEAVVTAPLDLVPKWNGEELVVIVSGGHPPYRIKLIRNEIVKYNQNQFAAGSHIIPLTEFRKTPGRYQLEVEDDKGQKASKTITIDPVSPANSVTLAGKTYRTIRLNGRTWLAQNLDYDIPGSSWYHNGLNSPSDRSTYGRLYTWEAARQACTALGKGWRLPTDEEWKNLANAYGGYYDFETSKDVGDPKEAYQALMEGGSSGFSALLGGYRDAGGSFGDLGVYGNYWSATEDSAGDAWDYGFGNLSGKLTRDLDDKSFGFLCRCAHGAPSDRKD